MRNADQAFEDTLIKCINLFKQYELNHENSKKEEGIALLTSAQDMIVSSSYFIQAPKWGCCLEYLVRRYDLDINTDDVLYELDVVINNQLNNNVHFIYNFFFDTLWINSYLLQRFLNDKSQLKYLTQKSINSMISMYIDLISIPQKDTVKIEPQFYFISSTLNPQLINIS